MKNHEQLETMLRRSLSERAGDVDTTPALYERVQRQATRGAWLRRGVALAGAAAVVAVAVAVIPPLLPAGPFEPDIAETPDDARPDDTPTAGEDTQPAVPDGSTDEGLDPFIEQGLAFAEDDPRGASWVHVGQRIVRSDVPVVSLAASPFAGSSPGAVAAGREDGTIGVVAADGANGDQFDQVVDAAANGGGVVFAPDGDAIAWIEGTDLHVLPLAGGPEGERGLPLVGEVPDDLRIEQWFYGADAQIILASQPGGGVWRIPMDDSNSTNSAPTDPAALLDGAALDSALLPSLQRLSVVPAGGGELVLQLDGPDPGTAPLPLELQGTTDVELTTDDTGQVVLRDRATGWGVFIRTFDGLDYNLSFSWQAPTITAVVPLAAPPLTAAEDFVGLLGLEPLPLVGTRGTDLLLVDATSGTETVVPVHPAESEATLGLIDARPGSTAEEAVIAYENFSEGETSIRFLALRDGEVELLDGLVVADAPLTGLVWSPDAMHVLWTTEAGTVGVADVTTADGTISTSTLDGLTGEGLVATDWTWDTTDADGGATGQLWFSTGQGAEGATELVTVARSDASGVVVVDEDREVLRGVAASPVAVGSVSLQQFEGRLELLIQLDDGRVQYLPLPTLLDDTPDTWSALRLAAVDGSVVVWTGQGSSFEVRLIGEGEVRNLPDATAWTPIG